MPEYETMNDYEARIYSGEQSPTPEDWRYIKGLPALPELAEVENINQIDEIPGKTANPRQTRYDRSHRGKLAADQATAWHQRQGKGHLPFGHDSIEPR